MVREWLGIVSLREFLSPNFHVLVLCRPRSTLTTYTPEGQGEEEGSSLLLSKALLIPVHSLGRGIALPQTQLCCF